jgi:hypothetical protein
VLIVEEAARIGFLAKAGRLLLSWSQHTRPVHLCRKLDVQPAAFAKRAIFRYKRLVQ